MHRVQGFVTHKNAAKIRECDRQLVELRTKKDAHLDESKRAQQNYRASIKGARAAYVQATADFNAFFVDYAKATSRMRKQTVVQKYAAKLAALVTVVEHDYQQDKGVPSYNASAQPGPVYFMSHVTFYLHVVVCHSLGDTEGPTRFHRNHVFTRNQCIGPRRLSVAKGSNDTVSTMMRILDGVPPAPAPPIYRTGYGEHGPIREPPAASRGGQRKRKR